MSIWDLLKARPAPAPKQITAIAGLGRGSSVLGVNVYRDPRRENEALWMLYRSNPWIARCVNLIGDSMSKGWKLVNEDDEEATISGPGVEQLEAFLNRPNDTDSWETLIGKIARATLIHGIAFLEVQRAGLDADEVQSVVNKTLAKFAGIIPDIDLDVEDLIGSAISNGIPSMMQVLPTWQIEVMQDKRGTITGYKQWTADGESVSFAPGEIVTILHPASLDKKYGNSPLEPISTTAIVDNEIRQRQKAMLRNAAAVSTIFHLPTGTSKENTERLNEQIAQRYKGVNAAGNFIVMSDPVTVEDLSKAQDGDFMNLKQWNKEEICQTLGVPMAVLGETSGTAMNGAGSAMHNENFQESTVRPLAAHIQRMLNERIFNAFEAVGVHNVLVKLVTESAEDEMQLEQMWDVALKNGSMTPNEVRAKRGDEALKDGGDEPYVFLAAVTAVKDIGVPPPEPPTPVVMAHPDALGGAPAVPKGATAPQPATKGKAAPKAAVPKTA